MSAFDLVQNILLAGIIVWLICDRMTIRAVLSHRKQRPQRFGRKVVLGEFDKVVAEALDRASPARAAMRKSYGVNRVADINGNFIDLRDRIDAPSYAKTPYTEFKDGDEYILVSVMFDPKRET